MLIRWEWVKWQIWAQIGGKTGIKSLKSEIKIQSESATCPTLACSISCHAFHHNAVSSRLSPSPSSPRGAHYLGSPVTRLCVSRCVRQGQQPLLKQERKRKEKKTKKKIKGGKNKRGEIGVFWSVFEWALARVKNRG